MSELSNERNISVKLLSNRHSRYTESGEIERFSKGDIFLVSERDMKGLVNRVEVVGHESDEKAIREARESAAVEISQANERADRSEAARLAAEEAQLQAEIEREG